MTIPRNPARAHLPWDDKRCDTVYVLAMALKLGSKCADMNAVALLDSEANFHWGDGPVKNHYTWIWTGQHTRDGRELRRPLTQRERNTPMIKWSEAKFLRLRQARVGGRRPATVAQRQVQANRLGVKICWEIKSSEFAQQVRANRFVAKVRAAGKTAYYMTLVTMPSWGQKLRAFKQAGEQTALMPHGARKTLAIRSKLVLYSRYIDRYWGHWA